VIGLRKRRLPDEFEIAAVHIADELHLDLQARKHLRSLWDEKRDEAESLLQKLERRLAMDDIPQHPSRFVVSCCKNAMAG
jgi:hypothetical protein